MNNNTTPRAIAIVIAFFLAASLADQTTASGVRLEGPNPRIASHFAWNPVTIGASTYRFCFVKSEERWVETLHRYGSDGFSTGEWRTVRYIDPASAEGAK